MPWRLRGAVMIIQSSAARKLAIGVADSPCRHDDFGEFGEFDEE
jgi:hypothetical protein